jgi:cell division protein FtsB
MQLFEKIPRRWLIGGGIFLVISSFVFSLSFRTTIFRALEIRRAEAELARLSKDIDAAHQRVKTIEQNSSSYETLVRSDLGYLRPGEKEVRFVRQSN